MSEQKAKVSAELNQPYDLKSGLSSWNLLGRYRSLKPGARRLINFGLATVIVVVGTYFALTQSPRSNPFRPADGLWEQVKYPIERNAFFRLPGVNQSLFTVFALPGTEEVWAAGSGGLILHSPDGGNCWEQQRPTQGPRCEQQSDFDFSFVRNAAAANVPAAMKFVDVQPPPANVATVDPGDGEEPAAGYSKDNFDAAQQKVVGLGIKEQTVVFSEDATVEGTANAAPLPPPEISEAIHAIQFVDADHGWAVGSNSTILATVDGGQTWIPQTSGGSYSLHSVTFLDGERGWAVGGGGTILATVDGGQTWARQTSGTVVYLLSVTFLDGKRGWAVGLFGTILTTVDGGQTWTRQTSGTSAILESVTFLDGKRGWAVGEGGTILTTVDGGQTWTPQTSGTSARLLSVTFLDGERGWAVGLSGTLLATVDGGETWTPQTSGSSARLESVNFLDGKRGWAVGRNGTILTTVDGGESWIPQTSGTSDTLRSVTFLDRKRGWAVGDNGTILTTVDGGETWTPQASGTSDDLLSVTVLDGKRGWAVGGNGTILTTDDGGQSWQNPLLPYSRLPAPWYYLLLFGAFVVAIQPAKRVIVEADATKRLAIEEQGHTDRPVASRVEDKLNFWPVSLALSRFLRNRNTEPPLTMAITGSWGSGKSSLMNLLKEELVRSGVQPVCFNAWHHESEEEHLLAALLQNIRQQGIPPLLRFDRGRFYGLRFRFSLIMNRFKGRPLLQGLFLVFVFANAGYWWGTGEFAFKPEQIKLAAGPACKALYLPNGLCVALGGKATPAPPTDAGEEETSLVQPSPDKTSVAETTQTPDEESPDPVSLTTSLINLLLGGGGGATLLAWLRAFGFSPAQLTRETSGSGNRQIERRMDYRQRFQREFFTVTEALRPRTMLILIDDLDRCQPKTVVQVLEAINFLTSAGRCYVVLGMARELVEPAVGLAFSDIAEEISHLHPLTGENGVRMTAPDAASTDNGDIRDGYAKRQEFAREYLEKLINLEIPVPTIEANQALALIGGESDGAKPELAGLEQRKRLAQWITRLSVATSLAAVAFWFGLQPYAPEIKTAPIASNQTTLDADTQTKAKEGAVEPPVVTPEPTAIERTATLTQANIAPTPVWPALLSGLLLLFCGVYLLIRQLAPNDGPEPSELDDTPEFSRALRIWNPVIAERMSTPRRLRRLMNRIRYMAVRLNVMSEDLKVAQILTEQDIVTLSALHLIHPDCLDLAISTGSSADFLKQFNAKSDWGQGDQIQSPTDELKEVVRESIRRYQGPGVAVAESKAAAEKAAREFADEDIHMPWQFDVAKIDLFKALLEGIRVH